MSDGEGETWSFQDTSKRQKEEDTTRTAGVTKRKPVPTPRRNTSISVKRSLSDLPKRQDDICSTASHVERHQRDPSERSLELDAVAESNKTIPSRLSTDLKNRDVYSASDFIPAEPRSVIIELNDREQLHFMLKHCLDAIQQIKKAIHKQDLKIGIDENKCVITCECTARELYLARDKIGNILNSITYEEKVFQKEDIDKFVKDEDIRELENRWRTHIDIKTIGTTAFKDSGIQSDLASSLEDTEQALQYSLSSNEAVHCQDNGIRITLVKGLLETQKDDVLVCTTPTDLNLNVSPRNRRILKYGGQNLKSEIRSKYPDGTEYGEIANIQGGRLHAHELYLGALQKWKADSSVEALTNFIRACLMKADSSSYKTISFPTLGIGKLGYPPNEVAKIMYDTVVKFDSPKINIDGVTFVCYHEDKDTCEVFELEHRKRILSERNKQKKWNIKVSRIENELGKHEADVLVCTCAKSLDLNNSGGASKSLFIHGGKKKIQTTISQAYPKGISRCGEIAALPGGELPCKEIYLTALPEEEKETQETLMAVVCTCLTKADTSRYKSIGFAALGSGKLGYSASLVARNMFTVVHKFFGDRDYTYIKEVHFVLYPKDESTIKAFKEEEKNFLTPDLECANENQVKIRIYGQTAAETENTVTELTSLINQKAHHQN